MTIRELSPVVATSVTLAGLVFGAGKYSQTVDGLVGRVARAEETTTSIHDVVIDLHARVVCIERDIKIMLDKSK